MITAWLNRVLPVGTRSVLWGAHCFFIHPFFVAAAWWKLYGRPAEWPLIVAFIVHDLGYWGKTAMDSDSGERHVELGAYIMTVLFDPVVTLDNFDDYALIEFDNGTWHLLGKWGMFSLLHSRYYSKKMNLPVSQLCVADKLGVTLEPWWLYLPRVFASGEIYEYLEYAQGKTQTAHGEDPNSEYAQNSKTARGWHREMVKYLRAWVDAHHVPGTQDTWTRGGQQ